MTEVRHLLRRTHTGQSRPQICQCSSGQRFLIKGGTAAAAELVAAGLAHHFGIKIPGYAVLSVPEPLHDHLAPILMETEDNHPAPDPHNVFGSLWLDAAADWDGQGSITEKLPATIDDALRLLAFDLFIDNWDRTSANPNLLVANGRLWAIDHEQAFGRVDMATDLDDSFPIKHHVGWSIALTQRFMIPQIAEIVASVGAVEVEAAVAAVPTAWWSERWSALKVVERLRDRGGIVATVLTDIARSGR